MKRANTCNVRSIEKKVFDDMFAFSDVSDYDKKRFWFINENVVPTEATKEYSVPVSSYDMATDDLIPIGRGSK